MADTKSNGIGYQKFRGNPENKLFYLIDNFIGGINTEFTDDSSSPADFRRIINFDMDRIGALHKRQGFGELMALSDIFNKLGQNLIPTIKNRTELNPNPEEDNDNVVYMKLLQNDNNCFRNLAGFSGKNSYREYQKRYGFQNNTFILLILTTSITDKQLVGSNAWYYKCTLPSYVFQLTETSDLVYNKDEEYKTVFVSADTTYQANKVYLKLENSDYIQLIENVDYGVGETIVGTVYEYSDLVAGVDYEIGADIETTVYVIKDNMTIVGYKTDLPVIFNWDRNLLNMENIEFYDKIYFTNNNKGLVCFNRSATINSDTSLANAFSYAGFSATGVTNTAFKPSAYEVVHFGYNMLAGTNPIYYVDDGSNSGDSIQGMAIFDNNFKPTYGVIPTGQSFKIGVYYTNESTSWASFVFQLKNIKSGVTYTSNDVSVSPDDTHSTASLRVYDITLNVTPSTDDEIEFKVEMENSSISPQYDYYKIGNLDADSQQVSSGLNVGNCGIVFMNDRALFYSKDTIWFSQLNDFTYIPSMNYITFPLEATDKITKICYFKKSYIVFTKQQIWKITGGHSMTLDDVTKEIVNESIGCHAGNTVVPIDNTLYFVSPRGLYSLKSNQFVEGYENVGELDIKVKTLTSDYTLYAEDREKPAIRYNGISERAYAFRYKDKYMLFYNNYNDKGDYAAENNLDVLVYQYELGAYTTYRFLEKPTFLFLNDNAIETFSTVKIKEEFTESETLFNYNLTNSVSNNRVIDLSGNGNDATIVGNAVVNESKGITLNGTNACGTLTDFNGNLNNGFNIQIDTKLNILNGAYLIDLQQESESVYQQTFNGSFETNHTNGYYAIMEYSITPNPQTNVDTVSYKIYVDKDTEVISETGSFKFKLTGSEGELIPETTVNFDVTNGRNLVTYGNFNINRDVNSNYVSRWSLNSTVTYTYTRSGINKGPTTYYDNNYYSVLTNRGNTFNWLQAGFSAFKAQATDTGCVITYTPAIRLTSGWYPGNPYIEVIIDGETYRHNFGSWTGGTGSSTNPRVVEGNQNIIYLDYEGAKTLNISIHLHGTFTRNSDGLYYTDYYVNNLSYNAPTVEHYEIVETNNSSLSGGESKNIYGYGNPSYRKIALKTTENDELGFILTSEYGDFSLYTDQNIGLLSRHIWNIDVDSSGNCNILRDGVVVKSGTIPTNYIVSANRTVNSIGVDRARTTYCSCNIHNIKIVAGSVDVLRYNFLEGSGTIAYDSSIYGRNLTLTNVSWIINQGLVIKDSSGYLAIPKLPSDIPFTNGFKIEFEGIINAPNDRIVRVIDLAKAYASETSANKFNSINVGFMGNMMAFNSTGVNGRTYRVEVKNIDTTVNHKYVVDCFDNANGYDISIYIDDIKVAVAFFNYGGIANVKRESNFIDKSNNSTETSYVSGKLLNMKLSIYGSSSGIPVYRSSLYEFDTTPTDFDKSIYVDLITKGINMNYPQHMKKLKHTFIKVIGGDELSQLFFELYVDGHLVNDPHKYKYYLDENGTIILDYNVEENLDIEGNLSIAGSLVVAKTKLDESTYQTIKMVIPKKGKNFVFRIYGSSEEFLKIDSLGLVCKLGKVKQG